MSDAASEKSRDDGVPIHSAAMATNVRRAAGSQTFFDVLDDFAAGRTLEVSCFSRQLGEAGARSQLGTLCLTRGAPVTSRRRGEEAVILRPPLTLADSAEKARQPQLTAFDLVTASGSFSVQIPKLDVDLVKHALAVQSS